MSAVIFSIAVKMLGGSWYVAIGGVIGIVAIGMSVWSPLANRAFMRERERSNDTLLRAKRKLEKGRDDSREEE